MDAAGRQRHRPAAEEPMRSVLILSQRERAELFAGTAQRLGFGSEAIVEKDLWVCWVLGQLFTGIAGIGGHLVFKGGTSLSKVYRTINRFSEDVDITIGRELFGMAGDDHDPEKASNPSQRKKRTEKLMEACSQWISGDLKRMLEERTRAAIGDGGWSYSMDAEDDTNLTLLFEYPSVLRPTVGH